jgi:hypothetical protein
MDRVLTQFDEAAEVPTATPGASAWVARDRETGRDVLVKRMPDSSAKTRATQALALNHPHVVATHRWLRDEDAFYVVRDYVPGRNLRTATLTGAHQAFDRLRATLDPILDALDYAHQSGLAHGGITPENVLVDENGAPWLCDFATTHPRNGTRKRYAPPQLLDRDGGPTERLDYFGLCELYKEFMPERAVDDEAGAAARVRLLRNVTEIQLTTANADELRYKLDAVTHMAELLGFNGDAGPGRAPLGAKLVCFVTPSSAIVNAGGGTSVVLTIYNEGDSPLRIEAAGSDVVWLNCTSRGTPFVLQPDAECDLVFSLSGARLSPGSYRANLLLRSNSGMASLTPPSGLHWQEHTIALPVIVRGPMEDARPEPGSERTTVLSTQSLPKAPVALPSPKPPAGPPSALSPIMLPISLAVPRASAAPKPPAALPVAELPIGPDGQPVLLDQPAIACIQEPDPALVTHGQTGVLHLGVRNVSRLRLRIDKVKTSHSWLVYPGEFQPVWIEPGANHYLGFSIAAPSLSGGDYKAQVTFGCSGDQDAGVATETIWRELACDIRVRIVPAHGADRPPLGCAPQVLLAMASLGALEAVVRMLGR